MLKTNRKLFSSALACALLLSLDACQKDDPVIPPPVAFAFSAPDTIYFEHTSTKQIEVNVQCQETKEFAASLSGVPAPFTPNKPELILGSNEIGYFDFYFNQFNVVPGSYACDLTVSILNENNTPQKKKIQLVYAPNCAYQFRNHKNGEITFVSNGMPQNKSITCNYNAQGQLEVNDLTSFQIVLDFDCEAAKVVMPPLTYLSAYWTGEGTIVGQEILFNTYRNGVLSSTSKFKP